MSLYTVDVKKQTKVHEMIEEELRARFDKEVSAPYLERLWGWLKKDRWVDGVCQGTLMWEDLKYEADRLAEYQREMLGQTKPLGRSKNLPYVDVRLTDLETEHAAALAPYLAKRAALLPEVRNFRQAKLNGGTLEPEEVVTFLLSELDGYVPLEEQPSLKWELEQDCFNWLTYEDEDLKDFVGGYENRSRMSGDRYEYEAFTSTLESISRGVMIPPPKPYHYGAMHLISCDTGQTLEDLGRWLVGRYPWSLRDAAWFVLTGESPKIEPIRISHQDSDGMYNIAFAPWVSEKTIRLAYRRVQVSDNRPLGSKSLYAFRFVDEHTELGQTPKWTELTAQWNEQHPNDKFRDRSALRRAYKRAERRLASTWISWQE